MTVKEQTYNDWVHAENIAIEDEMFDRAVGRLAEKDFEINTRYANEESNRDLFTPKQLRRMRKQHNKWRRRYFGKF